MTKNKNTLRKKLYRDMRRAGMQFLSIILLCALGTFTFAALDGMARMTRTTFDTYFEENNLADFWVTLPAGMDRASLNKIRAVDGVDQVIARSVTDLETTLGTDATVNVNVTAYDGEMTINTPLLREGELLDPSDLRGCLIQERFDLDVSFDAGRIMYRETIADTVEGVGHFEPLRHYAEVHLLLEPLPRGSGIVLESSCSEDQLDRNWQRLILTHLAEKKHLGVLTGSPLTDVKITLAAGKAHLKHTEGGDFRQATYRAVRQGLMQAQSVLLEPYYAFSLTVPPEQIGRAINDLRAMGGEFSSPEDSNGMSRIEGSAPVCGLGGYMNELAAYSHGRGRLFLRPDGYRPCKNSDRVIKELAYDAESDTENPADSVFCAHGAGFNVKWDKVPDYMHLESCLKKETSPEPAAPVFRLSLDIDERELEAIMEREFGPIRRREYRAAEKNEAPAPTPVENKKEYIIVDGYNVIFAWNALKALAKEHLDLARGRLMDMLSNYCGFTRAELVLVFDGYRSPGNPGSKTQYHNIHVAYTRDGETADAYIERLANDIGKNYSVRVITSDNLIRLSALRSGVLRTSSKEFEGEVDWVLGQIEEVLRRSNPDPHKTRLKDGKQ